MSVKKASTRGFTLIELLVVIAIIGILSATVLVSLNTARTKARTAAIQASVLEMRKLFELHYSDYGSYTALNRSWVGDGTSYPTCANRGYTGTYASQMVAVCETIVQNSGGVTTKLHTGVNTALGFTSASNYAIMAVLPNGTLFCAGSSGATSNNVPYSSSGYLQPGCYSNP